ncbi:DUF6279 family lipoprotein [Pseudomonas japonica]|uniref:DUF6279 family lipoprotein n=1 Tax=Pseudomonas japonica TaxID=256466 RepID=UPI00382CC64D
MSARPSRCLRPVLLMLASLLLLSCTRLDLAYRNLDVLVPWSLSDYLDMDRQQKRWLDERLKEQLAWHCKTQLPGYLTWLDGIRQMVASNQVTDQQLRERTGQAHQAVARVAERITPQAAELLRGMNDEQVRELRQNFARDIEKRQAWYVRTPLAQQIEERGARMEKRLSPWLGGLSPQQKERVAAWSAQLGGQNRQWIANRAHWQAQFSQLMEQRHQDDFEPRLGQLLKERERFWTPEYRIAFASTEAHLRSLLVDLMAQSSTEQRQHLDQRLDKVRKDFSELKCLKR